MPKGKVQNIIIGFNRKLSTPLLEKINLQNCLLEAYDTPTSTTVQRSAAEQHLAQICVGSFALYNISKNNKQDKFFNCYQHTKFYQLKANVDEWLNIIQTIDNILQQTNLRYHDNYQIEYVVSFNIPLLAEHSRKQTKIANDNAVNVETENKLDSLQNSYPI